MIRYTSEDVDRLNSKIETAEEALQWASDTLHPRIGKASSFGAEDAVVMDMMVGINPRFRFFTLDTGRLPQATHDIIDVVRKRYGIHIEVLFPNGEKVQEMVQQKGQNLFYDSVENRRLCCRIRKVDPMTAMLADLDGWITGLRRDQTAARRDIRMFEVDKEHDGILKINPIIHWSLDDIWNYIRSHKLPYNALLDNGYTSIGCEPCTRAIRPGEDTRAGRWWWEQGIKECGLHHSPGND